MAPRIGYLLPTREAIMQGRPETGPLLALAERAEGLGYATIWVGDSLLARPRHDPLTLLAAVAARTRKVAIGTAVFLPALRNPVVLAHQLATLDRLSEGRLVLGAGIATDVPNTRAEFAAAGVPFDSRVGRMMEGLRLARALWTGESIEWNGRWPVRAGVLGPTPHRPGGPPIWLAGSVRPALERAARHFDGWFANEPDLARWTAQWHEVQQILHELGRDPAMFPAANYVTLALDDDTAQAEQRIDRFLESYYGQPAAAMRRRQATFAGPPAKAAEWLCRYADAGVTDFVMRFAGEHERQLEAVARLRTELGW
ncbi:MAG TPA: LLM class flavin-dependent oxidoreductase [Stellaceae bacterium]|nr:LLM class flavin-dependent oxidoreductase [Stellaceae bacterium]